MLEKLGYSFDGGCHSGLDDSINIARIALELLKVCLFQDDLHLRCAFLGWLCFIIK
jgi:inhibitor of KinA sporulation pathway (predicted exonuclease)